MAEVLRAEKRKWMRDATAFFFGIDDRDGRQLLRFKLDTPSVASGSCLDAELTHDPTFLSYGARLGVVGCMLLGHNYVVYGYMRDYAANAVHCGVPRAVQLAAASHPMSLHPS